MTRRLRLSDHNVTRLRAEKTEYTVWDTHTRGLGLRVRPSGYRSFVFLDQREGVSKRHTLGQVSLMDISQARAMCRDILVDRETEMEWTGNTVPVPLFQDFVATTWKAACHDRFKLSSCRQVNSMLKRQLLPAFGDMPLDRIARNTVNRWFDRYSATAPGGANRTLDLLCRIMNLAIAHGHVRANPARGIRRNPRRKLTRFLSRDEIDRLHVEIDRCVVERPSRHAQADIIRLLLFTGCRRGEILNLRWEEVGDGILDLSDSKTGPRRVYLNSAARAVITRQPRTSSPYVFPSPGNSSRPLSGNLSLWLLVRQRTGIDDVRLHDLRHTLASHAVLQGIPLPMVARLLGHRQVSMTLRYAHVHDREVEAAAERIGEVIMTLSKTAMILASRTPRP